MTTHDRDAFGVGEDGFEAVLDAELVEQKQHCRVVVLVPNQPHQTRHQPPTLGHRVAQLWVERKVQQKAQRQVHQVLFKTHITYFFQ